MNPWMFDLFLSTFTRIISLSWGPLTQDARWLTSMAASAMLLLLAPFVATVPEATSRLFWGFLKALAWIWLIVNLQALTDGFSDAIIRGGLAIGYFGISLGEFTSPGTIFETGYNLWEPVLRYNEQISTTWYGSLTSWATLIIYAPCWFMGMLCYFVLSVHITMALIEFELVTIFALLLLPWAMMPGMGFVAEGTIASIVAVSVRLGVLAAITSIGLPLLQTLQLSAQGDPGYYQMVKTLVGCGIFAILSWTGPALAGSMLSGTPAGLGSSALVVGTAFVGGVVRGASQVASHLRRRQSAPPPGPLAPEGGPTHWNGFG